MCVPLCRRAARALPCVEERATVYSCFEWRPQLQDPGGPRKPNERFLCGYSAARKNRDGVGLRVRYSLELNQAM